jgi:hypothetical protein
LIKYVTLTDDIDSLNLSSTHHDPSGKNSGLLSGSYWQPEKKGLFVILDFGPLGFQPNVRTKVPEQECSTTKLDHSSLPTEKCHFFALDFLPHTQQLPTQNTE